MLRAKPEIKLDALTDERYFSIPLRELSAVMEELGMQNRKWMNRNLEKTVTWVLVDKEGEIIEESDRPIVPSYHEIRKRGTRDRMQIYMFIRSGEKYRDTTYFLGRDYIKDISMIFERDPSDFFEYLNSVEGIVTVNAQSGLVNKLSKYAAGRLTRVIPLLIPGDKKGGAHAYGATVADIGDAWENGQEQIVRIASQNIHTVHANGSKVSGERTGSKNSTRFERLHRFDDPVLDLFDTYRFYSERFNMKSDLVLFGPRKDFDPELEQRFSLEKYRTF